MKCPECESIICLADLTLDDVVVWIDTVYPKDIFKSHPIAWVRRLLKFLNGDHHMVLIDEDKYSGVSRKE